MGLVDPDQTDAYDDCDGGAADVHADIHAAAHDDCFRGHGHDGYDRDHVGVYGDDGDSDGSGNGDGDDKMLGVSKL